MHMWWRCLDWKHIRRRHCMEGDRVENWPTGVAICGLITDDWTPDGAGREALGDNIVDLTAEGNQDNVVGLTADDGSYSDV